MLVMESGGGGREWLANSLSRREDVNSLELILGPRGNVVCGPDARMSVYRSRVEVLRKVCTNLYSKVGWKRDVNVGVVAAPRLPFSQASISTPDDPPNLVVIQ